MSETPQEMASDERVPEPVEQREREPGVDDERAEQPRVDEARVIDVTEAPETDEAPFAPADETLRVGEEGPAAEEPGKGQVEVLSQEEAEPELPPTIDAIGEGPTDLVTDEVEQEEPVTAPDADVARVAEVAEAAAAATEEPDPASTDPFRGPGDWYVVHT